MEKKKRKKILIAILITVIVLIAIITPVCYVLLNATPEDNNNEPQWVSIEEELRANPQIRFSGYYTEYTGYNDSHLNDSFYYQMKEVDLRNTVLKGNIPTNFYEGFWYRNDDLTKQISKIKFTIISKIDCEIELEFPIRDEYANVDKVIKKLNLKTSEPMIVEVDYSQSTVNTSFIEINLLNLNEITRNYDIAWNINNIKIMYK